MAKGSSVVRRSGRLAAARTSVVVGRTRVIAGARAPEIIGVSVVSVGVASVHGIGALVRRSTGIPRTGTAVSTYVRRRPARIGRPAVIRRRAPVVARSAHAIVLRIIVAVRRSATAVL